MVRPVRHGYRADEGTEVYAAFDGHVTKFQAHDPAADTAPVQRNWISHAGNVQHVLGAGLVDVWKVTGPLDPLACAAVLNLPPATK